MTHAELVKRAEKWLRGTAGCGVVITDEMRAANNEQPDALGWRGHVSILVECKVSRSDFLADRKKWFRRDPDYGMGAHRYFMCPPKVIQPDDLPDRWRLLWAEGRRVRRVVDERGNIHWGNPPFPERNITAEVRVMYSALRRLTLRGVFDQVYEKPWEQPT